ncbi:hypothetical protein BGW42_000956 [Actinomortierella wolfii]|nr:hypothetical protein BGW42_000956 [Actinomortierella wolfii]
MGCVSSKHLLDANIPTNISRKSKTSEKEFPPIYTDTQAPPAYAIDMKLTECFRPVLSEPGSLNDPDAAVGLDKITQASKEFNADPKNLLMQNAATSNDFSTLLLNRNVMIGDTHVFNTKIPDESKVTNQKQSGRCWIFAGLNTMRVHLIKKYNLENDFELSQGFLFFYDKFEKSNWFLESIIDTRERDVNDRTVQYLLKEPVGDGGQYAMLINLVEKYGLVPKSIYPESFSSSSTARLNALVLSKLRDYAVNLRRMHARGASVEDLRREKERNLKDIYRILAITLGEPPSQPFTWAFHNKDKKYFEFSGLTPRTFYDKHVGYKIADTVSLIHDPRNKRMALYTIQYLGNIAGGRPIRHINAEITDLEDLAIKKLKSGKPVWFGADVGKYMHRQYGILDPALFQYDLAFNVKFEMNKAERLIHSESLMTHAMVFTGVHLDDNGRPVRWRVENSWGEEGGDKGYLTMSAKWFREFVYQIVVEKDITPQRFLDVLDQEVIVLPAYDPMGSLA